VNRQTVERNASTFIIFQVAETHYALHSSYIQQLEMVEHITPVPNAAAFVEGVVFSRGNMLPAFNLRSRFGLPVSPHTTRSRLVVTHLNGRTVALIVDSAREFLTIPEETIQPPPHGMSGLSGNYLKGIATVSGRVILIVDLYALIAPGESRGSMAQV
jgi:purine-binding chemotaxis protein CheW